LVFVFSDVPGHLDRLHWVLLVDARRSRHVRMLPFSRRVVLLSPSKSP
jgi:hypothetical protein